MRYNSSIIINKRVVDKHSKTYFVADIAANHNGDLERAISLIKLAKEAGADAVKFQHFLAKKIVSDYGFKHSGVAGSHQASWKKTVYEIYSDYECDRKWSERLADTAKKSEIDLFTTPYDFEAVDDLKNYLSAFKIGSGDITWTELIEHIAKQNLPVLLATGASDLTDVKRAVEAIIKHNKNIVLMQCNTNYTAESENFKYINLNVLKKYSELYPDMLLGLSDHTKTLSTVLGAVSFGAKFIEKHFTDDDTRTGPDHAFSLTPKLWKEMMERTRELENAIGSHEKKIEDNEKETVILQRRALRLTRNMKSGETINEADLEPLRPAPAGSVPPYEKVNIIGSKLLIDKVKNDALYFKDLEVK